MSDKMPPFSFKRYRSTIVKDVDSEISLVRILAESISELNGNILVSAIVYHERGEREIRIWVLGDKVYIAGCNGISRPYRIVVEVFDVAAEASMFDIERVRTAGVSVIEQKASRAEAALAECFKVKKVSAGYRIESGESRQGYLRECIERVWEACGQVGCSEMDPLELLRNTGVLILGKGEKYLCITRDREDCGYSIIVIDRESAKRVTCVNSMDGVEKIVLDALAAGFKHIFK